MENQYFKHILNPVFLLLSLLYLITLRPLLLSNAMTALSSAREEAPTVSRHSKSNKLISNLATASPTIVSEQPLLKAPWFGEAFVSQGNKGGYSHNVCGVRKYGAKNCTWENTYAIDVSLSVGTPVLAPADGKIVFIKPDTKKSGGREVGLEVIGPTGKKFVIMFLHLKKIEVKEGWSVRQGSVIAKSGASSGGKENGTSPHLHFHIWNGEKSRDSHTLPTERLVLGDNDGFREFNAINGDLDDGKIAPGAGKTWKSNNTLIVPQDINASFASSAQTDLNDTNRADTYKQEKISSPGALLSVDGNHDQADCNFIAGWVWNPGRPYTPLYVDIFDGSYLLDTVLADEFRSDLLTAQKGDGVHAFSIATPRKLKDGRQHTIKVTVTGTGDVLPASSKILSCSGSPLPQASYEGYFDELSCDRLYGWAWERNQPDNPISVDIYDNNTLIGTVSANEYREDLETAGKGNGYHSFNYTALGKLQDGALHTIRIKFSGTNIELQDTPRVISCSCGNGSSVGYRNYGENLPPIHPNGTLIKSASSPTIYLIENGAKRMLLPSVSLSSLYQNGGFASKEVVTVDNDELNVYPEGQAVTGILPTNGKAYPDGKLILFGSEVSIVTENGMRRPFASESEFIGLGYLFCNVIPVSESIYKSFRESDIVDGLRQLLILTAISPLPTQAGDWGSVFTYTVTVKDNAGNPVSDVDIGGDDELRNTAFLAVNKTNSNGQTVYATSVPDGKANGTFNIKFQATREGFYKSTIVTRQVRVSHSTQTYMLSVKINGLGRVTSATSEIDCSTECRVPFPSGSIVELNAAPNTGYRFNEWRGACSGASCRITMNSDKEVTADFLPLSYELRVGKVGAGTGTVFSEPAGINCGGDCSEFYSYGQTVYLHVREDSDSKFESWSDGDCRGTTNPCILFMTSTRTATAIFSRKDVLPPNVEFTWRNDRAKLPAAKRGAAAAVFDNQIYVFGGSPGARLSFRYNPSQDSWSAPLATVPGSGINGGGAAVFGQKIYAVRSSAEKNVIIYDPATDSWKTDGAEMPTSRGYFNFVTVQDKIYAIGGFGGVGSQAGLSNVDIYYPSADQWSSISAVMPSPRGYAAAAAIDEKIYVIGGVDAQSDPGIKNSVEVFDTRTRSWAQKAEIPTARWLATAVAIGKNIYVIGGYSRNGEYLKIVEEYDTETNTWRTLRGQLQIARAEPVAGVVNGKIFAIGGSNASGVLDSVEEGTPNQEDVMVTLPPDGVSVLPGGKTSLTVRISKSQSSPTTLTLASSAPSIAKPEFSTVTIQAGATEGDFYVLGLVPGDPVTITATMPTLLGGKSATARVTVQNCPNGKDFNPKSGPLGTVVLIDGVALDRATRVSFGDRTAQFKILDNGTKIEVTVPSAAITGQINIFANNCNFQSIGRFTVTPPSWALSVSKGSNGSGTVTSSPPGIDCGGTCQSNFNDGATVTLTATPAGGSIFAGWGGDCSGTVGTMPCTLTMNNNKSVIATFTQSFQLTVNKAGSGSGTVTSAPGGINCGGACQSQFNNGATVMLTAAEGNNSTFAGWGGACTGTSPTCTVVMDAAKTVTATFNSTCTNPISVSIPANLTASPGSSVIIPVNVGDVTGRGVISYNFKIDFDSSVLRPQTPFFDVTGTLSNAPNFAVNGNVNPQNPNQLIIIADGTSALSGSGTLLNLKFDVIGAVSACSDLSWISPLFNNGTPCATSANGRVCVTGGSISGTVSYCNAPTKKVPGVVVATNGAAPITNTTNNLGVYSLPGLGNGPVIVTPTKSGDVNGIISFDVALIRQHLLGINTLSACAQVAADSDNSNTITSFDVALIRQFLLGLSNPSSIVGTWKMTPANRSYASVAGALTGQDFTAVLVGDVDGSWTPPGASAVTAPAGLLGQILNGTSATDTWQPSVAAPASSPLVQVPIALPTRNAMPSESLTLPITVGSTLTGQGVISYNMRVNFDSSVLQPQTPAFDVTGTLSNAPNFAVNASVNPQNPNQLIIIGDGTTALSGQGTLLNLKFTVVGANGKQSPLTFEPNSVLLNADVQTNLTNGGITVGAVNTPPTITPAAVTRQAGSPVSNSQIATVNDAESGAVGVMVTVTSANPANGVTISNIVNTNGTVTANVIAACGATNASFTLTATDGSLTAPAALNVTVNANTQPTLTYNNTNVPSGGATIINPATGPSDNGNVASIVLLSQGTYTGTINVNNTTGVVSISSAAPVGTHTITIRATDNCGGASGVRDATFQLTVTATNTAPTFTPAAAISRQLGSAAGAAVTVGTVSDAETAAGSLTVTQIAGGTATGITVTNIVNTNGTITAQVAATCTATAGTVRFQVSDGSLTGTGDLQVNVTANSAPVLTYAAATVNAGSSTSNSPTAASDNGSITGYNVQSAGTYTGTISVNASGVVSISNAAPVGVHTLTIRATDNCGATTNATFTLTVMCPTTITVNPATLPNGTVGTAYNQTVSATGGTAPYGFMISAGALPNGLSLNPSTGAITGTPTTTGPSNFTIKATDANGCMGTQQYAVTITPPCLSVASINPTSGATGSTVTITGSGFTSVTAVKFSNNVMAAFTVVNATTITATVPAGAVTGPITISKTGCADVQTATFTLQPPAAPIIKSLEPDKAVVGGPAFTLTVNGMNFIPESRVLWNGVERDTTYVNSTKLTAAIPPSDLATMGSPGVVVFNPGPGGGASNTVNFTVGNPEPMITGLSRDSIPAGSTSFTLSVTGKNFLPTSRVQFENMDRPTTYISPTQLDAKIYDSDLTEPRTIWITVFNPPLGGGKSNTIGFTIGQPLRLTSLAALSTPVPGQQFFAKLEGSGFDPAQVQVVVVGPGCPENNPCMVPNDVLTGKSNSRIERAPLTISQGTFQVCVRNGNNGTRSNSLALNVSPLVVSVSAASYLGVECATNSILSLFGSGLASGVATAPSVPLPNSLLGTSVKITDGAGIERTAPLFFVSPTQINYLLPVGVTGTATVAILRDSNMVGAGQVQATNVAPGLFGANANGQGVAAAVALRIKSNGAQSFEPVSRFDQTTRRFVAVPIELGSSPIPDQVYLILFGTGIRGRSSLANVTATVGGATVAVSFAGAQGGLVGVDQLNLGPLPVSLKGRGNVDIVLRVDGKIANTVQINIK